MFGLTSRYLLAGNLACSIEHVRNFSAIVLLLKDSFGHLGKFGKLLYALRV